MLFYSIFQSLTSCELRYSRCFNLYHLSGTRIAANSRRAFGNTKCAEPYKGNAVSLFKRIADGIECAIE